MKNIWLVYAIILVIWIGLAYFSETCFRSLYWTLDAAIVAVLINAALVFRRMIRELRRGK